MTLGEASNNYVGHEPEVDEGLPITCSRKAFIEGANWAVENAVKWISDNIERYIWYDETELLYGDDCGLNDLFFDDFREAMKK